MKPKESIGYQHKCYLCGRLVRTKIPKGGDGNKVVPWRHKTGNGAECMGHLYAAVKAGEGRGKVVDIPKCPFCGHKLVVHRILNPGGEMYYCACHECREYMDTHGVRYGHTWEEAIERAFGV